MNSATALHGVTLSMIQSDTMKTSRTVPGQIIIKVFRTNRVLKLIRLSAPIEQEEASIVKFVPQN